MTYAYLISKASEKGRCILVLSDKEDFTLEELHTGADCHTFEIVRVADPLHKDQRICLVIDDIGKITGKRINMRASLMYGSFYDYIAGDAIICKEGIVNGEHDLVKFTQEEAVELVNLINHNVDALYREVR